MWLKGQKKERIVPPRTQILDILQFDKMEENLRKSLIQLCASIILIGQVCDLLLKIITEKPVFPYYVEAFAVLSVSILAYWLSKVKRYRLASWLLITFVTGAIFSTYLEYGTGTPLIIGFWIPIALAITLLPIQEIILVSVACVVFTIGLYIAQNILQVFSPFLVLSADDLALFSIPLITVSVSLSLPLLIVPAWFRNNLLRQQNNQLKELAVNLGDALRKVEQSKTAIIETQEDERSRLANELHDETSAPLNELARLLKNNSTLKLDQVEKGRELTETIFNSWKNVIKNWHAPELEIFPLYNVVEMKAQEWCKNAILALHLGLDEDLAGKRFAKQVSHTVYMVLQQSITNTINHAQACNVMVSLAFSDEGKSILLKVTDDGIGFIVPQNLLDLKVIGRGHFGLSGSQQRAENIGGQFRILSTPGKGTQIILEIPALEASMETG